MWWRFAVRTAGPNYPWAGLKKILFAVVTTGGSSMVPGNAAKVRIRSCPTEEYLGLIFVFFGEGEPPPLPRYPEWDKKECWIETYVRPCNFMNNLENDPVHIPFTHRESEFFLVRSIEIRTVIPEETDWGVMLTTVAASGRTQYLQFAMPISL